MVFQAASDSESEPDEKRPAFEEDEEMDEIDRRFDAKKWIALAQICLGIILIVLEVASKYSTRWQFVSSL